MNMLQTQFLEIIHLIKEAKTKALRSVNTELINLHWNIGEYISKRVEGEKWGKSIVKDLATFIEREEPDLKGFSDKNLWRMLQFYNTYKEFPKLSALLREISWTNNLIIISAAKSIEEKEFYIRLCSEEKFSSRELERQIKSCVFERVMIGNKKLTETLKDTHSNISNSLKDTYVFEFLNLPDQHNENELQKALIKQMKDFILELGRDFLFMGEEYRVQVGNSDFFIDLVFYHRNLQCLVAIELKTEKFKPEHIGQLNFYLEALDRDVKKHKENPSIGILLCKGKESEVVEYALSRSLSPTMVSDYQTQLPDKKLLERKLHELFENNSETIK